MRAAAAVGGLFLASRDPKRLAAWYRALGLPLGEDGTCVLASDGGPAASPVEGLVFAIHEAKGELPGAAGDLREEPYGRQRALLNLRVRDLEGAVALLRKDGTEVAGPRDYGYGVFAWAKDPDGNLVELWQPGTPPA